MNDPTGIDEYDENTELFARRSEEWEFDFDNLDDSQHSSVTSLPKQLHPAVSIGMKRVASCYFSMNGSEASNSVADLFSLWNEEHQHEGQEGLDILCHDILMHVFTFLDASSLSQFSQTARRPNFECFYFLQLELQRALLSSALMPGSGCISRLAHHDGAAAQAIVQDYVDSNSSLKTMPLSHSLAYLRHVLQRHGFQQHITSRRSPSQALASAALCITMVGAASSLMEIDSAYTLIQYGLGGALVASTAKTAAKTMQEQHSMRKTAEEMARTMQTLPQQMWRQLQQMRHRRQREDDDEGKKCADETQFLSNPYIHEGEQPLDEEERKLPSGCVGAYSRAVHSASLLLQTLLKEERKRNFESLGEDDRLEVSRQFMQACASDDCLEIVKDMVVVTRCVDVDAFCVGPDGMETCALHTAAFNGACKVLEFLVRGIDEHSAEHDGGLADVNIRDANNWTALHFCAGANAAEAVSILANHGAELALEASNGYTPFHWAQRLSNHEVSAELQRLGADQRFLEIGWLRQQPLSAIANRFFAMATTQQ